MHALVVIVRPGHKCKNDRTASVGLEEHCCLFETQEHNCRSTGEGRSCVEVVFEFESVASGHRVVH